MSFTPCPSSRPQTAIAKPKAPTARPGHTISASDSFLAALSELRDADAELVDEAGCVLTESTVVPALVGDEPPSVAVRTLVTVDCCDVPPEDAAGTVVKNVEVASLTVLTVSPAVLVTLALVVAVVSSAVPFWMVGIGSVVPEAMLELTLELLSPELVLMQVMEPTCTVFVLRSAGLLLVNARPAIPVPLA